MGSLGKLVFQGDRGYKSLGVGAFLTVVEQGYGPSVT